MIYILKMKYELTIAISILMILGMILVYYTLVIFMSPYEHNSHAKYVDGTNSKTLTYDQFSTINISSTGIPKLIFRTGESSLSNIHHDIHDLYEETIDTNPTYQQIYFNVNKKITK